MTIFILLSKFSDDEFYIARKLLRRRHIMKERRELREAQERERRMKKKRSRDHVDANDGEGYTYTDINTNTNTFHNHIHMPWGNSNGNGMIRVPSFQRSIRYKSSEYDDSSNNGTGSMIGSSFHHRLPLAPASSSLSSSNKNGEEMSILGRQRC